MAASSGAISASTMKRKSSKAIKSSGTAQSESKRILESSEKDKMAYDQTTTSKEIPAISPKRKSTKRLLKSKLLKDEKELDGKTERDKHPSDQSPKPRRSKSSSSSASKSKSKQVYVENNINQDSTTGSLKQELSKLHAAITSNVSLGNVEKIVPKMPKRTNTKVPSKSKKEAENDNDKGNNKDDDEAEEEKKKKEKNNNHAKKASNDKPRNKDDEEEKKKKKKKNRKKEEKENSNSAKDTSFDKSRNKSPKRNISQALAPPRSQSISKLHTELRISKDLKDENGGTELFKTPNDKSESLLILGVLQGNQNCKFAKTSSHENKFSIDEPKFRKSSFKSKLQPDAESPDLLSKSSKSKIQSVAECQDLHTKKEKCSSSHSKSPRKAKGRGKYTSLSDIVDTKDKSSKSSTVTTTHTSTPASPPAATTAAAYTAVTSAATPSAITIQVQPTLLDGSSDKTQELSHQPPLPASTDLRTLSPRLKLFQSKVATAIVVRRMFGGRGYDELVFGEKASDTKSLQRSADVSTKNLRARDGAKVHYAFDLVKVYEIEDLTKRDTTWGDIWDDLYYDEDALAEFKYQAFLEECDATDIGESFDDNWIADNCGEGGGGVKVGTNDDSPILGEKSFDVGPAPDALSPKRSQKATNNFSEKVIGNTPDKPQPPTPPLSAKRENDTPRLLLLKSKVQNLIVFRRMFGGKNSDELHAGELRADMSSYKKSCFASSTRLSKETAKVTYSLENQVFWIEDLRKRDTTWGDVWDDLYFDADTIAEFKYQAFLEECGIENVMEVDD